MKPMKFLTALLCMIIFSSIAQNPNNKISLKGIVTGKENNDPLAYVSVGVIDKSQGTVSDSTDHFAFSVTNENLSDTLQFSIVGYNSLKIAVSDFLKNENKNIILTANENQLAEVIVTASILKNNTEIIGRQKSSKLTQISIHNKTSAEETIGSEMGMRYKTGRRNAILKDFNFYISANNFDYIKFKINI